MQNLTNTQGTINKFLDIVKREGNGSALDILEALTRSTLKYDDTSHNINGIPFEYFGTPVQRREYQEEQAVFESHLSIECCNMKGDLPF